MHHNQPHKGVRPKDRVGRLRPLTGVFVNGRQFCVWDDPCSICQAPGAQPAWRKWEPDVACCHA